MAVMARNLPTSWPPPPRAPDVCALCERAVPHLTQHHLVPRSQGRRRGVKVANLPTVMLCPPCHKFLHKTFTNAELASTYPTVEALRAHPDVARFLAWLCKQPPTRSVRVR